MKKVLALLLCVSIVGCSKLENSISLSSESSSVASEVESSLVIDKINELEGRIAKPSYVYDDFENGVDAATWHISTGNWSSAVSNGLKAENVGYTKDGILVLTANGEYYPSETMKLTGAGLLSKEALGAGKYEIAMKVMPRLGACTAFWTFYYENDSYNHEIDIELPGNKSYENVINTNWTGVGSTQHTSKVIETLTPANDGKWHKYTFEWHTNPQVIRYYVDDVLTAETTTHVPTAKSQLWLAVWFPNRWAGVPDFETDYMLVDWVGYQPYDEPTIDTVPSSARTASIDAYPTSPMEIPIRNLISNSRFSNVNEAWVYENSDSYIMDRGSGFDEKQLIVFNNSSASQEISAVYGDFKLYFSFLGKVTKESKGQVVITSLDENKAEIENGVVVVPFTSKEYQKMETTFQTPKGTKSLKITFQSMEGSIIEVDDVTLRIIENI